MKKNIYNFTILSLLILCLICILTNPSEIMKASIFSLEIWRNNIFPSLFPFFILSDFLINYGFVNILGKILKQPMKKLFHLSSNCAFVFVMSIFSGFPSSAKYIARLYQEKQISWEEANNLICFTHFSNPLFIMGTVFSLLNDYKICIYILLSHYISNIIIGIFYKEEYSNSINKELYIKRKPFIVVFKESIENTIHTLIYILGTMTVFLTITTIIFTYIDIDVFSSSILRGLLEITQGIKYVSSLSISSYLKGLIITGFLSFGGICIHMQVLGIIKEVKIKYSRYLFSRVLHALIAIIIYFVLVSVLQPPAVAF